MKLTFFIIITIYGTGCVAVEELVETNEMSIVSYDKPETNRSSSSRTGRKFFNKLKNGAAFLAGVKIGSYITSKGYLLPTAGHGSLASAHNFQLFGKTVSTALSLSYGNNQQLLPLNDPIEPEDTNTSSSIRSPPQHVLITVLENPTAQTLDKLNAIAKVTKDTSDNRNEINNSIKSTKSNERNHFNNLVQQHNQRVKILNQAASTRLPNSTRLNSKF